MLISVKNRFVFISNTKTASTSLESALLGYCEIQRDGTPERKHVAWRDVAVEYGFLFGNPQYSAESFFRFGIIREPLDWFVSWYNYRLNNKVLSPLKPGTTLEDAWRLDDWVKWEAPGKKRLQKTLFVDDDQVCRFDAVIPLDELGKYLPQVLQKIGVKKKIPVLNESGKSITVDDVDPGLIEEIKEFWREDYEFYEEMKDKCQRELTPLKFNVMSFDYSGLLDAIFIDEWPLGLSGDKFFDLNGGVVLSANAGSGNDYSLIAADGQGEYPVEWGIDSPLMAESYPENPNAHKARFKATDLQLSKEALISLFLVDANGERYKIVEGKLIG